MKYSEFLIEFTKALNLKNSVSIFELVVNEPFHARRSINDIKTRTLYAEFLKENHFAKNVITEEGDVYEGTSTPAHAVRSMIKNREFNIYTSSKMHVLSDFVDSKRGMIQVKNHTLYDNKYFLDHWKRNRQGVHEVEIYTNNNEVSFEYDKLKNPIFTILQHENLEKFSFDQINEMLEQFHKNETEYLEIKNTKITLLIERHNNFVKSLPKIKYTDNFDSNPQFNLENPAKEEQSYLLRELKKIHNIPYKK